MPRVKNPSGAINNISPGLLQEGGREGAFKEKQHTTAILKNRSKILSVQESWSQEN